MDGSSCTALDIPSDVCDGLFYILPCAGPTALVQLRSDPVCAAGLVDSPNATTWQY